MNHLMTEDHKNAIDYIKNSSFYTEERYNWLRPIIDAVLTDSHTVEDTLLKSIRKQLSIAETNALVGDSEISVKQNASENVSFYNVKRIESINNISNVGLLEISKPIILNEKLNIFYGQNAAGKSSIFSALCKSLGKEKRIYPNINKTDAQSSCSISITNETGIQQTINWKTGQVNQVGNVKVFDSLISNYLVDKDQINEFEIAHLKAEYFSFLHSMLEKVSDELGKIQLDATKQREQVAAIIETTLPDYFKDEEKITEEDFVKLALNEQEKIRIGKIDSQIKILEQSNIQAVIKNMKAALQATEKVLQLLGEEGEESEGKVKKQYFLKYTKEAYLKFNERVKSYQKAKQAFGESKGKLIAQVPEGWISKVAWDKFIESGVNFIQSLVDSERKKYTEENCLFCQQPLKGEGAKELIKSYQEIQSEHQYKLKEAEIKFSQDSNEVENTIIGLKNLLEWNQMIEAEFSNIGKEDKITVEINELGEIFEKIKIAGDHIRELKIIDKQFELIESTWTIYHGLMQNFSETIESLNIGLKDKQKRIDELRLECKHLKYRRDLLINKESILLHFKLKTLLTKVRECQRDMTVVKQNASRLETKFSKEESLKLFTKYLKHEYENFSFTPPPVWKISASTNDNENKRIYSLGDKRLAEIFSEGERKVHALADFFAEAEMKKYQGVFIFDDPINSLDEKNIEATCSRIQKLVDEGNQVIVFTHNLFFLYSLSEHHYDKQKVHTMNRLTETIHIESDVLVGRKAELKKVFQEMEKRMNSFVIKNDGEISEFDLREVYNLMSGYLETYVEAILANDVITRYRANIRMASLDKLKSINSDAIDGIQSLYNQTSRKGSRHSQATGTPPPTYSGLLVHFEELKKFHEAAK